MAGQNIAFPALYDGLYTPPVLRVQPGDTIEIRSRTVIVNVVDIGLVR